MLGGGPGFGKLAVEPPRPGPTHADFVDARRPHVSHSSASSSSTAATMASSHQWRRRHHDEVVSTGCTMSHRHFDGLASITAHATSSAHAQWIDGIAAYWSDTPRASGTIHRLVVRRRQVEEPEVGDEPRQSDPHVPDEQAERRHDGEGVAPPRVDVGVADVQPDQAVVAAGTWAMA